jgi:hypothetical protein
LGGNLSLQFEIKVGKDHGQVKATWDIHTDGSDTELIANFVLNVEGKKVDTQCSGGNKACNGAAFAQLAHPTKDCPVTFAIITNGPETKEGNDVLRGDHVFDDVEFS